MADTDRRTTTRAPWLLAGLLLATLAPAVRGQCDLATVRIPGQGDQRSGAALAAEGDWLVVGAPRFDGSSALFPERGAARVYRRSGLGWEYLQDLVTSNPAGARIGSALDMTAERIVAGAPRDQVGGQDAGAVYVAARQGSLWVLEDRLTGSGAAAGDGFGVSVAIWEDLALVGAPGDDTLGDGAGAAYLFDRSGGSWTEIDVFTASDGAAGDAFGTSVDLRDGAAIVGAPGHDAAGAAAGTAYVFEESGGSWTQVGKLEPTDAMPGIELGTSVSIAARLGSARLAFVGAPHADYGQPDSGAVYTFIGFVGQPWGGSETQKLGAGSTGALVGSAVQVDAAATRAVFGAPGAVAPAPSAYVFEPVGNPWITNAELRAADSVTGDGSGLAVALSGSIVFVGAPRADLLVGDSGATFAFGAGDLLGDGPDCDGNGTVDVCDVFGGERDVDDDLVPDACEELGARYCSPAVPSSNGLSGHLTVLGSDAASDDELTLWASDLPPSSNIGYFLMGGGQNTFTPPGSAGPICIAPGLLRYLPPPENTTELGGGFTRDVGTSGPISGNITAGSTWNFQAWHRDGMNPSNLTDAVSVTFL